MTTKTKLAASLLTALALAGCETAGDGVYMPPSIIELIPPGISQEQIYSRPSAPDGVRCYMYQEIEIEILVGCADIGILG